MWRASKVLGFGGIGVYRAARHLPSRQRVAYKTDIYEWTDRTVLLEKLLMYDNGIYAGIHTRNFSGEIVQLDMEVVDEVVVELRRKLSAGEECTGLFGKRHNDAIEGIVRNTFMEFGGHRLYPTVESQAAQLLYSVLKGHPFLDGNKRIAVSLFLRFLEINGYHVDGYGDCMLNNDHLLTLVIIIAESKPEEQERMIKMVVDMLVREAE